MENSYQKPSIQHLGVFLAFFLSGCSALLYEVVWSRMLTLFFGASLYGQSLVLAFFMGGLALGAQVFGTRLERVRQPLKWYALMEGIIGILGAVSIFLPRWVVWMDHTLAGYFWAGRLCLCVLFLFPATVLMGGTFPALFRALDQDPHRKLNLLSSLYVVNTVGAVSGIAFAGYFLIARIGVTHSLALAALINLILSGGIWLCYQRSNPLPLGKTELGKKPSEKSRSPLLWALLFSGAATMTYELSWSRALHFSLGSSTYTFSLILLVFLGGLSLGAGWVGKNNWDLGRCRGKLLDYQVLAGAGAVLFCFIAAHLPLVMEQLFALCHGRFLGVQLMELLLLSALMGPTAFFIGASFPILCMLVERDGKPTVAHVGQAFAWNTVGAIGGALVTGFFLIPWLGPFQMVWITLLLHGGILWIAGRGSPVKPFRGALVGWCVVAILFGLQSLYLDPMDLLTGAYARMYGAEGKTAIPEYLRHQDSFWLGRDMKSKMKNQGQSLLTLRHGRVTSVAVTESGPLRRLVLDGKTDGSTGPWFISDMPTQTLLSFLPLSHAKSTRRGLVIGLGTGVTAGQCAKVSAHVDCLEIEPEVVESLQQFSSWNHKAHTLPQLKIHIGDARFFLRQAKGPYDYISAEPSNLWMAGVANLFSEDYFKDCYRLLDSGGVMVQWLHLYKLSLEDCQIAIRTFSSVFPEVEIWGSLNYGDIFIMGWKPPRANMTPQNYSRLLQQFPDQTMIQVMHMETQEGLKRWRLLSNPSLRSRTSEGPIHTDDRPVLEFSAGRNMFQQDLDAIFEYLGQLS